ncbi:MAG: PilZ domain-containing protein [Nitrospiria bacterium]
MIERRKSTRHSFHLGAAVFQDGSPLILSLLRANIGFGGIGGFSPERLSAGSPATIRFTFPQRSGADKQEEIAGNVIWAHKDGNFNAQGIAFVDLSKQTHPLLFSYLQYSAQYE